MWTSRLNSIWKLYWLLIFSWNCQILKTGCEPLAPFTTHSTGANPDMSQYTNHIESGSHNKSKSFTAPLLMSHHTSTSQLLVYQKNTIAWHFFFEHTKARNWTPAFAFLIQTPVTSLTLFLDSYFTVKDTKMESWYKCIRCSFGEVKRCQHPHYCLLW